MAEHTPKATVEDLKASIEAARHRMHLHRLKNLSNLALRNRYPSLIKLVHFDQADIYDPATDQNRTIAAFTIWSAQHHRLAADGQIVRGRLPEDSVPEGFEGFIAVSDNELEEDPDLIQSIKKSTDNMAQKIIVPSERGKWVEKPVTRARLRQPR